MSGRLAGKTALITAAGQGIGYATAMAMANEGASVFATDVKPELLERFKGVAGVTTRKLDVLDVAADYVQKGIRCNGIAPGTVDTPSLHERIGAFADPEEARRMFITRQPMGRLATPEEIAPIIVFLASDEAAFVTGNIYSCDGGMTI